jgi:hypothetical protein
MATGLLEVVAARVAINRDPTDDGPCRTIGRAELQLSLVRVAARSQSQKNPKSGNCNFLAN